MSTGSGAIVLAAGFSKRYGSIKLAAKLPNGLSVFQQTLNQLSCATSNILIVSREELKSITGNSEFPSVYCDDAHLGMGYTIACGIARVAHWDACLICLSDMPLICTDTYKTLLAALLKDNIVIPTYAAKKGNPVGFGRNFFPQLTQIGADTGGTDVIRKHRSSCLRIAVDDAAILQDIDTRADLDRISNLSRRT